MLNEYSNHFDASKLAHTVLTRPLFIEIEEANNENESKNRNMIIDTTSQRNLNLLEGLFKRIDYTKTDFGRRQLSTWILAPEMNIKTIKKRQELVSFFTENSHISEELNSKLLKTADNKNLPDIPTLLQKVKIISKEGLPKDHPSTRANIYNVEQYAKHNVKQFCLILDMIDGFWKNIMKIRKSEWYTKEELPSLLTELLDKQMPDLTEDIKYWATAFDRETASVTGNIRPQKGAIMKYDEALAEETDRKDELEHCRTKLADLLGISIKQISFVSKPKHPYLIRVDAKYENKLLKNGWNIHSTIKQTKKDPKRFLVTHDTDHLPYAREMQKAEEKSAGILREEVTTELFIQWVKAAPRWLELTKCLSILDAVISLASYSNSENDCEMCVPEFVDANSKNGTQLHLVNSKHPCITLPAGQEFVKNNLSLKEKKLMILTGPNMGGKTTLMRQAALSIVLAQIGSLVPAEKFILSPMDRIFTRIGGSDNLSRGESTFFIELNETASILQHATERSFIIIDELGRGTSTHDGTAIAFSVYERLVELKGLGC